LTTYKVIAGDELPNVHIVFITQNDCF